MAIFPLSLRARHRIFWVCGLATAAFTAKLWLRFGPDVMSRSYRPGPDFSERVTTPPGAFRFHALGILKAELGYPRRLEGFLPAPEPGSNEAALLKAQDWWNGKGWTAKARGYGEPDGHGLRIPLGELVLGGVDGVSPARDYNGPEMCQVDYGVRWEVPAQVQSLVSTRNLPGLRLPEHFDFRLPGERRSFQATLVRNGMGWSLQDADLTRAAIPGHPGRSWAWLSVVL
ncbi:MAG TPA: hypothetical protein VJ600_04115 [Holophagaceae bacterium]|nr:hypothetical protein [Holophagaceae bacterium]